MPMEVDEEAFVTAYLAMHKDGSPEQAREIYHILNGDLQRMEDFDKAVASVLEGVAARARDGNR